MRTGSQMIHLELYGRGGPELLLEALHRTVYSGARKQLLDAGLLGPDG
jgi:hypothetical protein